MKILFFTLLVLATASAFAGQRVDVLIGKHESQSVAFEDKKIDGTDAYYLEHNTLQKQKIFRAVTKKEFKKVTDEYAKVQTIFKKKGRVIYTEPCGDSATVTAYQIEQIVCLDGLSKSEKLKFMKWFKDTADLAVGPKLNK